MTLNPLETMRIVPLLNLLAGVLIMLVCRPLIQGKVGPNRLYGIRTPLAFSSEENWYKVNRFGGRLLSRAGKWVAIVGLIGLPLPEAALIPYAVISAVVVVATLIVTALRILAGPDSTR